MTMDKKDKENKNLKFLIVILLIAVIAIVGSWAWQDHKSNEDSYCIPKISGAYNVLSDPNVKIIVLDMDDPAQISAFVQLDDYFNKRKGG